MEVKGTAIHPFRAARVQFSELTIGTEARQIIHYRREQYRRSGTSAAKGEHRFEFAGPIAGLYYRCGSRQEEAD